MLGKHDLNDFNEHGSKNFSVREIVLHPEWQWNNELNESYHADLSIAVLKEKVIFNLQISPVCLPNIFVGASDGGIIAGWGKSNFFEKHATKPNELRVPIINADYCLPRFPKLVHIYWNTLFCGGYEHQEKGACLGDSGGGFYINNSSTLKWIVQGIISGSLNREVNMQFQCDVNAFQLYTNVSKFSDWIEKIMRETTTVAMEFVDFNCLYE
jgi:hypothetical protein